MARLNRNIITKADAGHFMEAATADLMPKSLDTNPPAGFARAHQVAAVAAPAGAEAAAAPPAGVTVPTEDDYLTKLLKYVPLEVLGAYLFMAGVIDSNVTKHDHAWWLGGLLIGILILTIPYDVRVLGVVRPVQIAMSVIGLTIYIFSIGGWFATTSWYHVWYASIALPVFGLLVAILKLKPLPLNNE